MKSKTVTVHVPVALKIDFNIACAKMNVKQCWIIEDFMTAVVEASKKNSKSVTVKINGE